MERDAVEYAGIDGGASAEESGSATKKKKREDANHPSIQPAPEAASGVTDCALEAHDANVMET